MKLLFKNITLLILFIITSSCSSKVISLHNLEDQPVPDGIKIERVKNAIKSAATRKGWRLKASKKNDNSFLGYLDERNHSAVIQINYSTQHYSINYVRSNNLNYNPEKKIIHRNYMKWIKTLKTLIDSELFLAAEAN